MKHVKKYEAHNIVPKFGDYVICEEESPIDSRISIFVCNNVGIITNINSFEPKYMVYYYNVPPEIEEYFIADFNLKNRNMYSHEILHFSKSREELELKLMSTKYNL